MILHFYKPKSRIALIFFLILALFSITYPVHAQDSAFDMPSGSTFGRRSGQINGTVYLNRGAQPASQVVVSIRSMTATMTQAVLTDLDGHFELREIPQGTYQVTVSGRGSAFASTITEVSNFPAQVTLYVNSSKGLPRGANPYVVSAHELKIPEKAQNEYYRGLDLMAKKDLAGSLAHFSKAAAEYRDYYEAVYQIGLVEFRLDHQDKAAEAFQKAIDLSAGHYARAQFA